MKYQQIIDQNIEEHLDVVNLINDEMKKKF